MPSSEEETQEFDESTGLFTPTPAKEGTDDDNSTRTPTEENGKASASGKNKINIFVTEETSGKNVQYKIYKNAQLNVMMANACAKLGINENEVSFMHNGKRLNGDDTAEKLNIEDLGDIDIVPNTKLAKVVKKIAPEIADQAVPEKEKDNKIEITVSIDQKEIKFRQNKATDLKKLFRVACQQFGINQTEVSFFCDGQRITSNKTPIELEMDDEDARIEIFQRQSGGILAYL